MVINIVENSSLVSEFGFEGQSLRVIIKGKSIDEGRARVFKSFTFAIANEDAARNLYFNMQNAKSAGVFFNKFVKGKFDFTQATIVRSV